MSLTDGIKAEQLPMRRSWSDVAQVEMLTAQEIKCPISLETPVCPQITPCGHVFAFPSILAHLMNHGGNNLRKASPCPLCFQPIVARELRLVQIKIVCPPKVRTTQECTLLGMHVVCFEMPCTFKRKNSSAGWR